MGPRCAGGKLFKFREIVANPTADFEITRTASIEPALVKKRLAHAQMSSGLSN
jgi:hypothetical protein